MERTRDKFRHTGTRCHGCEASPIVGKCYKCENCPSYHLCNPCFSKGIHRQHRFYKSAREVTIAMIIKVIHPDKNNSFWLSLNYALFIESAAEVQIKVEIRDLKSPGDLFFINISNLTCMPVGYKFPSKIMIRAKTHASFFFQMKQFLTR